MKFEIEILKRIQLRLAHEIFYNKKEEELTEAIKEFDELSKVIESLEG